MRASSDLDCGEERDTAQLDCTLDGATTEGGAEKALLSDGAESEGQEPGSEDDDAAPTDDGVTDDDAADVQQLTAIAQRLTAQQGISVLSKAVFRASLPQTVPK